MRAIFYLSIFAILYGSLFPFDFNWQAGWARGFAYGFDVNISLSDLVANILLFVPYGVAITFGRDHSRRPAVSVFRLAMLGVFIAALAQILQIGVMSRSPSFFDIVINIVGIGVGIIAGLCSLRLGNIEYFKLRDQQAAILLSLFIAYELAPFVPTLDVSTIWGNFKHFFSKDIVVPSTILRNALYWLLASIWLQAAFILRTPRLWLVLLLGSVLLLRLVVWQSHVEPSHVIGGVLGALIGMWAIWTQRLGYSVAAALCLALVIIEGLTPLNWRAVPQNFAFIPFAGLLGGSWLANVVALLWKAFVYGGFIWLCRRAGFGVKGGVGILVLCTVLIEFAQVFIASGTPEITDPILVVLFAWLLAQFRYSTHDSESKL